MRQLALVFLLTICISKAEAQTIQAIDAPEIAAGDSWTYKVTTESLRVPWHQEHARQIVDRVGNGILALSIKTPDSDQPARQQLSGADWSRSRSVNGQDTVVNRPLSFPLFEGKTWVVEYTEEKPNAAHSTETFHSEYKVVGHESVDVPAGNFDAVKIEVDGKWTAELAPLTGVSSGTRVNANGTTVVTQTTKVTPKTITGRLYKAYWYVPAVKRYVKTVEEYYDTNGRRTERFTNELEAFVPAAGH
jgi:hypothetical protein